MKMGDSDAPALSNDEGIISPSILSLLDVMNTYLRVFLGFSCSFLLFGGMGPWSPLPFKGVFDIVDGRE
jgi:hypothetical protein